MINKLIWIDQNVNEKENKLFIVKIQKKFKIKVVSFNNVDFGLKYIIDKCKFELILVIVSGRFFPSYCEALKKSINDMTSIPISIIFTLKKDLYKDYCNCKEKIGDAFYNPGGVVDSFIEIETIIERYLKKNH